MIPSYLIPAMKSVVQELVIGNYAQLEADGRAGRLTAEELRRAVTQYGRRLVDPPNESIERAYMHPIKEQAQGLHSWAVDLDLWTVEEGQSDLTLSMTVQDRNGEVFVQIDDLHVL